MKIYFIRHGATKGNLEHRYVGSTDESLLPESGNELLKRKMPEVKKLYVSPMKRCRETADILYPNMPQIVIEEFRECDFGDFEYCNYRELNGNPDYQRFIDTLGKSGFPGGEDRDTFQKRCIQGFGKMMKNGQENREDIAAVLHGGTIMAILDWYSLPHRDYYDWQVKNGSGFCAEIKIDEAGGINLTDINEI